MKTDLSNYDKKQFEIKGTVLKDVFFCELGGEVQIPEGVTSIARAAFCRCANLKRVVIPNGVTEIGEDAFCHRRELHEVVFPDGLKSIGIGAFYKCSELEKIDLPDSVTYIGYGAFGGTEWRQNQWYGEIYIGNVLYDYKGERCKDKVLKVREGTKAISPQALYGAVGLTGVFLPASLEHIGETAFPSDLTGLEVEKSSPYFKSENNCILSKDGKTLIKGCKSSVIPCSVTEIADHAFDSVKGTMRIVIPARVTKMGDWVFRRTLTEIPMIEIFCEAEKRPSGWSKDWIEDDFGRKPKVIWGYKGGKNENE